jgi:hypothetical protein
MRSASAEGRGSAELRRNRDDKRLRDLLESRYGPGEAKQQGKQAMISWVGEKVQAEYSSMDFGTSRGVEVGFIDRALFQAHQKSEQERKKAGGSQR